MYWVYLSICSHILKWARWSGFQMRSMIKLELCAWMCNSELGHSLAFCWDLIKASTYTKQMDKSLQKNAYFAYFFCILEHIIWHILQILHIAICKICRIWTLHYFFCIFFLHIFHIVLHTLAYYLTYSVYLHIAICKICRIWTLHYVFAYFIAHFAYWFA